MNSIDDIQKHGFLAWLVSEHWRSTPKQLFHPQLYTLLSKELDEQCDEQGYVLNHRYWRALRQHLQLFAAYQKQQIGIQFELNDPFANYAALYDAINGQNNLQYIAKCLQFFIDTYDAQFAKRSVLSAGCGTGIVEAYMIEQLGVDKEKLFGFDLSEAMVQLAQQRIHAEVQNVITFQPEPACWDFCCAWTNVLQYLPYQALETALSNLATTLKPGGYFVADFITPDHIRRFPNVLKSQQVRLLRQPSLWYENQNIFQMTELFNVSQLNEQFIVTYEGQHKRFLPSLPRVRALFAQYFSKVDFYDVLSLVPLRTDADTSESTRYLLIAQK